MCFHLQMPKRRWLEFEVSCKVYHAPRVSTRGGGMSFRPSSVVAARTNCFALFAISNGGWGQGILTKFRYWSATGWSKPAAQRLVGTLNESIHIYSSM